MLSTADNELLCRVGPGTPMGDYLRRFWTPALACSKLPEPDCDPVEVRLLGQDFVAFRDTDGKVGFVAAAGVTGWLAASPPPAPSSTPTRRCAAGGRPSRTPA